MKKHAVIFDMDGVISDTQKFHAEVESIILREYGITMKPADITNKYAGISDEKMFGEIFEKYGIKVNSLADIIFRKWDLMRKVAKGKITAIPHVIDLINLLKINKIKLAVASASTKEFIREVIDALELQNRFDVLVSAQEVKHGKPAPDIFLLAAKRLGVQPENSVVIEDGRSGMIAAEVAHMKSIGLVSDTNGDYPATELVSSLKQVTLDLINAI